MLAALERTVAALDPAELDAAAVELARAYALQIDRAAGARRLADRALRKAQREADEPLVDQVAALRAKLSERECVDRIGARFHALLVELTATPKARGGAKRPPATGGALGRLRAVQ